MAGHLKFYIFGDQTYDVQPHLKDLLSNRDDPVLENFLVKAYDAVRTEIYKLPPKARDDVPRFTCLEDLVLWKGRAKRYAWYNSADQYRVFGLCTGALAAAAISCSRSTVELVPMAVIAVTIAFRIGTHVADVAKRIAPSRDSDQSWSVIVPGSTSHKTVDHFCEQTMLPVTSRPYISAYAPNGITVSGPPRSLAQLVNSENFKDLRCRNIPIYGPYHASHLYSKVVVGEIVENLASGRTGVCIEQIPLFPSTGSGVGRRTFSILLEAAAQQILLRPIRWSDILDELQACIHNIGPKSFCVIPIGTTADQLIYNALKQTPLRTMVPSTQAQPRPSLPEDASYSHPRKAKLTIIGMSGRFPGAKDNESFWNLLYQGLDVHKPVPDLHWNAKTHVDRTGTHKNTSATPFGCWLDDPAMFDARFFNISPREAPQIDPAQRLALMTAYEAIEQAGIVPDTTPSTRQDRVGVFYGVTSNDWMETNSAQNIDTYFIPGGNRAFIPGRINYCFKFSGPSYAVDTACSSSLAGIHLACNSLWQGDIDTAITGGTNILTNPDFTAGLDRGHFLSRTGNCKTFDDGADGYCRGEGVGTVIIKRLDDALADNDPILGVILGAYTNHSAESESITRPHIGAQRAIFDKILNQGGVEPYTVSYVEMHGTGTQAGDAGEMSSVLDTFAPPLSQVRRGRTSDETLYLGSAKSNIGHGEAASGVSSLVKVLLMMQKNIVVPHCGIKSKINHKFPTDLRERNVNIALEPTTWKRSPDPSKPRRVFVNNFSAAGGNTALLLEDAPLRYESPTGVADPRGLHLIAVSAKNGISLEGNLRSILKYLKQYPHVSLGQLSYTTTARRIHYQHRVMLAGSFQDDIRAQIETALRDGTGMTRRTSASKIIFTFTGQGAQYPGMGKQLWKNFSLFRTEMHRLDHVGQSLGFPSMLTVIESEEQDISAFEPATVQLAGVCLQIALSKLWTSWNISPIAVIGHSLGEYAALVVAGVLSDADALYLVGKRAELLQKKCMRDTHAMLVVKGSVDEIARVLEHNNYEIACMNSPTETVLAGPQENISILKGILAESRVNSTLLKVPYAFHSSQIDLILPEFERLASVLTFSKAIIPVLCPLDGTIVDQGGSFGPEYLANHSRKPVNMLNALQIASRSNVITDQTTLLEIGPHPAISGMTKAVLGSRIACIASLQRGKTIWQTLGMALKFLYGAGVDIRWGEYQRDFKVSHTVISLPAYNWDLKEYWIQYVNDWSLRKGDPPPVNNSSRIETTTVHRVVEETCDSQKAHLVVEADIAREDLSPLVQGHEVDGIPLCTPSVYADIALTLGNYLLQRYRPSQQDNIIDVSDMIISKALTLRSGATQQLLQAHADVDWLSQSAAIRFLSSNGKQKLQEHSRCVVYFKDRSLQRVLQEDSMNVKQNIRALQDGIISGKTARFNRPMVYRAIRPLARFHLDYRAIDEIILNSNTLEASSRISFGSIKKSGKFYLHPAIIDSLTQSCGFTMNCNDSTDLDTEVFMNHGWGSFQIFEPMEFDKEYTTYTCMKEGEDKLWHGDVIIFEGEKVVAHFEQIAIQGVPRRILKAILSMEGRDRSQNQQPAQKTETPITTPTPAVNASQSTPPATGELQSSKYAKAMSIIAEESGLAAADLTDDIVFGDVGIDSLLGLTISGRFQEELDIEIDFNALFYEYPTVASLKGLLGERRASPATVAIRTSSSSESSPVMISVTGATTPDTAERLSTPAVNFQRAIQIISEESGVAIEDLNDDINFTDSGVDSLLSLVIVSRFRDELELDIKHESLFLECPTVADLKHLLAGNTYETDTSQPLTDSQPAPNLAAEITEASSEWDSKPQHWESEISTLAESKKAVDAYVQMYTAAFSAPSSSRSSPAPGSNEKVVLITGASGSLGSHLVYHLAQLPEVKKVVCLNRENKAEPNVRQQKAMREKGIRFPEDLKPKLLVLQTDSSKPMLGLSRSEYEGLLSSVTHLIHNAWPMSAKRPLDGFRSQFQIMHNLTDLAYDIVCRRPECFKLSFQMVSSIGVVGHYGRGNGKKVTVVPEERVGIDSVLPNGYGNAKWVCERMLDETLHKHPDRFRTMAVRLGQIAGSKTSGYWNPMEHFGFLIKSSQTLNALPDVDGTVYWTPVNDVAGTLSDLVLSDRTPSPIYHIENPIGQPWHEMNATLSAALNIPNLIPFEEWVERVRAAPRRNNPATTLLDFLDSNYLRMSCGGLVLDVKKTLEHSKTLGTVGPVDEEVTRRYIHIWKEIGFLT
ncbi:MAG: hypothetical protein Q9157_006161 [Trypethelium eluteriae]